MLSISYELEHAPPNMVHSMKILLLALLLPCVVVIGQESERREPSTNELFGELKSFGKILDDKTPHRFRPLMIDHDRSKREYENLLQLIPAKDQIRLESLKGKKNAFKFLVAARQKYIEKSSMYDEPDSAEVQQWIEYLEVEAEKRIPWESKEAFESVENWIKANAPFYQELAHAIRTTDFCSRYEQPGAVYDSRLDTDEFMNLQDVWFLIDHVRYQSRRQDWPAVWSELQLLKRHLQLQKFATGQMIDYLVLRGQIMHAYRVVAQVLQHPGFPPSQLPKAISFLHELRECWPNLVDAMRLDVQRYVIGKIAQIPQLTSVHEQIPALYNLAERDHCPKGMQFQENEDKAYLTDLFGYFLLLIERAEPVLQELDKPFDKSETVQAAWNRSEEFIEDYQKHAYPFAQMNVQEDVEKKALLKILNYDDALNKYSILPTQSSKVALKPLPEAQLKLLKELLAKRKNPLGFIYLNSSNESLIEKRILFPFFEELHAARLIQAACQMHEVQLKKRPANLGELVQQGFLKEVPLNPFTAKPFAYDSERGVFWRTGKEGTDNGKPPKLNPDEIDVGEENHGIFRLISAPEEVTE